MSPGPAAVAAAAHAAAARAVPANAWISVVDAEILQERARALEARGPRGLPLYGVPFAVKDNIDVAGLPTTAACPSFAYAPERDAPAVARLVAAGALVIGKTNMDQFATGLAGARSPYGACASVFDPAYVSGGSSSGSALAVASGAVTFALGTDTAGSGRVPAAFNGLVGLKPTRGLVSRSGVVPAVRSLDCVSVFAPDAGVARDVLDVLAGAGAPPDPVRRLGVPARAQLDLDRETEAPWARAVTAGGRLAEAVVEVDVAALLEAARLLYRDPWLAERRAAFGAALAAAGEDADPTVRAIVLESPRSDPADVRRARERLATLSARAAAVWRTVDALVLPTTPGHPTHDQVAADPVGSNARLGIYTNFVNLLDLCAVAVPSGLRADGLPYGVTLLAPAGHDRTLLDLAARWPAAGGRAGDRLSRPSSWRSAAGLAPAPS